MDQTSSRQSLISQLSKGAGVGEQTAGRVGPAGAPTGGQMGQDGGGLSQLLEMAARMRVLGGQGMAGDNSGMGEGEATLAKMKQLYDRLVGQQGVGNGQGK